MRIYTKRGDKGTTFLTEEVAKDADIIHAMGKLDAFLTTLDRCREHEGIPELQEKLSITAGEIVGTRTTTTITEADITALEEAMDAMNLDVPPVFVSFTKPQAQRLSEARVACRALERRLTPLLREEKISPTLYAYINRLSDYLFSLAFKKETR
ncbi:MAG: ATP:cob(I)alamin adenosyltransferase [Candidatus Woesearchaeota archaeon]|nr:ATP:cob(I)alamin adenosyltransferase [Candidatus Woesearchaeota archaeon]